MDIFSVFGIRGRSKEVYQFDDVLRVSGLEPEVVPFALKLATIKLLKETNSDTAFSLGDELVANVAQFICYSILGPDAYKAANGSEALESVENRLNKAIKLGDNLDARVMMLTLLSKVIHPQVVAKFDLSID